MRTIDHVAAVERELGALSAVIGSGPVTAPVPTCPGWALSDLTAHVGRLCGFWAHVLCEGTGRPKPPVPEPPAGDAIVSWLDGVSELLLAELRSTPGDTAVWTWHPLHKDAAFAARRLAHEVAVHRYDAQSARGECEPIDAVLAADGIDELVGSISLLARRPSGEATGQSLHVHGTDEGLDAEWLVVLHPEVVEVRREHAKGDLALRGGSSDLELLLYQRPTLGPVERFGDEAVLDLWYRELTF